MSNPFNTGLFNCCTCPDPDDGKYLNRCGCPHVVIECESEQKNAEICGHSEFTDPSADPPIVASEPPKKYLKNTVRYSFKRDRRICIEACNQYLQTENVDDSYVASMIYDPNDCSFSFIQPGANQPTGTITEYKTDPIADACVKDCGGGVSATDTPLLVDSTEELFANQVYISPSGQEIISNIERKDGFLFEVFLPQAQNNCNFCSGRRIDLTVLDNKWELFEEDTEEDAIERATPTEGTSCSSLYELRTTGFTFTVRTVKYTAKATNLCPGRQYRGCIRIRRREAYAETPPEEADLEWHEIEPDLIEPFFPDPDEDGFTIINEDVELPNEQGFEYEIIGGNIWPVDSDCECPTEYEAEEE